METTNPLNAMFNNVTSGNPSFSVGLRVALSFPNSNTKCLETGGRAIRAPPRRGQKEKRERAWSSFARGPGSPRHAGLPLAQNAAARAIRNGRLPERLVRLQLLPLQAVQRTSSSLLESSVKTLR